MAYGCSHATYADPKAQEAVLKFRKQWIRPRKSGDRVIDLGDFTDMSAFMSKAKGEGDPIKPDIEGGLSWLEQMAVTDVLGGNHEARLWREMASRNEIVAYAATELVSKIETKIKRMGATFLPYRGVWDHLHIGNYKFTHGTVYSENATRDMAEMHGNVVHAHTHRAGVAKGRRDDNPTAFGVGTLTRMGAMEYANTKKSSLAWSQGFVWGEYCDDLCVLWLHEQPTTSTEWRLPV